MRCVTAGKLNKHIAEELGASEKTIKIHRGRVMEKMGVASVADLVRVAQLRGRLGFGQHDAVHARPHGIRQVGIDVGLVDAHVN